MTGRLTTPVLGLAHGPSGTSSRVKRFHPVDGGTRHRVVAAIPCGDGRTEHPLRTAPWGHDTDRRNWR